MVVCEVPNDCLTVAFAVYDVLCGLLLESCDISG